MTRRLLLALLLVAPSAAVAQDAMHPEPPEFFAEAQQPGRGRVLNERIAANWLPGGDRFWYRKEGPDDSFEFVLVEAARGEKKPLIDHAKLAEALGEGVSAKKLSIKPLHLEEDGSLRFSQDGKIKRFDAKSGIVEDSDLRGIDVKPEDVLLIPAPLTRGRQREGRRQQGARRGAASPSGAWSVQAKGAPGANLVLTKKDTGREWTLTSDATESDRYESGVFWSPDSSRFIALKTAKEQDHPVSFVQSSPANQVQPKVLTHQYLKPGDRIAITKPHLFNPETKEEIPIRDDLFQNPWNLSHFHWSPDSSRFYFVYNARGHQALRLICIDAKTGEAKAIVNDESKTFIDYSNKTFCEYLDDTGEVLWMSERSGWNHLYLIDAKTGDVKNAVTSGEWLVRGVDNVNEKDRTVEFRAMGHDPKQDPYHVHFARARLDGSSTTFLTDGDGVHTIAYSPDRKFILDSYSRVDLPPVHELRKTEDGSLVCEVERADIAALESSGWKPPERFTAKGRDGKTDIWGIIHRPADFDPKAKYPVIEQIYAGPHGAHVPKTFGARGPRDLLEAGFLVVQIDGMGTNWRSKAFHDVCWKNIKDAGFPDRIAWMKSAAETYPELDLSRVGIYGGSAGGQNAMAALLFHGDFYRAAAADCGCHDNRMDKIWWNEAWMGWPVDQAYEESSNVANAHRLNGRLLLTVGETDHNVDPASTMQVVNALIKADKPFELIVFPGADHGAGGSPYGRKRMRAFFEKNLRDAAPGAN